MSITINSFAMEHFNTAEFQQQDDAQFSPADFQSVEITGDHLAINSTEFYDESGNYRIDEFESLGGLHYMNYLHSHDDML